MPRDGSKNLIPFNQRTKEEVKEIAKKGGINSGESRRKKKLLKDTIEDILSMTTEEGKTYQEIIVAALVKAAENGDVKAFEVVRDTIGQKPTENVKAEIELPVFQNDLDE